MEFTTNEWLVELLIAAGCSNVPMLLTSVDEASDLYYTRPLDIATDGVVISTDHADAWTTVFNAESGVLVIDNANTSQGGMYYIHGYQDRITLSSHLRNIAK
jgi:hypothetical protein